MTQFAIDVEIQAPPETVCRVLYDTERWPEWTPTVSSVTMENSGPLTIGSRARILQSGLPPALWEVTELQDRKGFTWATRRPGVLVTASHIVESLNGGCRVTLVLQFSGLLGPVVAFLTRGLNRRYLSLEANGLKKRSEGVKS